jgi:glycosyltransferase involved in cell wall biosynthesis
MKLLYPLEIIINIIQLCWIFRKRDDRTDIIFDVHGAANIAPIFAARMLAIPVVWHFHEINAAFSGLVKAGKIILSGIPHRYVVVAEVSAQIFDISSPYLIPGSVDIEFWKLDQEKVCKIECNEDRLRLITVGNINPLKGVDILLEALSGLSQPWELIIVGAELNTFRKYAEILHNHAVDLMGQGGHINFVGWQESIVIRDLMTRADVFVLPSRSEACPISLLEAMAMEVTCVASAVGDVKKIFGDSGCGFVFSPESPAELQAILKQIDALGKNQRREIGRRARARVVSEYSEEIMVARHLNLYLELIGRFGRGD